jgi:NADH dehydrogenase [ubiquinone] 1 alpha subcomplex assembly factor 1
MKNIRSTVVLGLCALLIACGTTNEELSRELVTDVAVVETDELRQSEAGGSMMKVLTEVVEEESSMTELFDFTSVRSFQNWRTVDDRVMGGVSRSRMIPQDGFASFQGNLSLENNGGFASVRSPGLDERLPDVDSIRLKVRGDGRTYQLSIRTDRVFDGVRYRTSFDTEDGVWEEVVLSLQDFSPTWRGRRVPGTPDLRASDVRSFGLMLADKREGQFRLDLESLSAE